MDHQIQVCINIHDDDWNAWKRMYVYTQSDIGKMSDVYNLRVFARDVYILTDISINQQQKTPPAAAR